MKRLSHIFINTAAALSLLLALATAGLWVRSYWRMEEMAYATAERYHGVAAPRGQVVLFRGTHNPGSPARGFIHLSTGSKGLDNFGSPVTKWGPIRLWKEGRYGFVAVPA